MTDAGALRPPGPLRRARVPAVERRRLRLTWIYRPARGMSGSVRSTAPDGRQSATARAHLLGLPYPEQRGPRDALGPVQLLTRTSTSHAPKLPTRAPNSSSVRDRGAIDLRRDATPSEQTGRLRITGAGGRAYAALTHVGVRADIRSHAGPVSGGYRRGYEDRASSPRRRRPEFRQIRGQPAGSELFAQRSALRPAEPSAVGDQPGASGPGAKPSAINRLHYVAWPKSPLAC
jgi:hypothetical protein